MGEKIRFHCPNCGAQYAVSQTATGKHANCTKCSHRMTIPSPEAERLSPEPMTLAVEESNPKAADEKFCSDCGAVIKIKAELCPKCGVRQRSALTLGSSSGGQKSKLAAVLLALLLGGLGAHKLYLGNIVMGIVYLLFCWTFIPAIVALIEGIVYATMSETAFAQKYG